MYTNKRFTLDLPKLSGKLENQAVSEGADATFSIRYAGGNPRPTFQWFVNDTEEIASNETYEITEVEETLSLAIRKVKTSHAATYHVRLVNEAGTVESNKAMLSVNCNKFELYSIYLCSYSHINHCALSIDYLKSYLLVI